MVKAKASAATTPCSATVKVGSQISKKSRTPTSFETRLYELCKLIPKGKVTTYGNLAAALNSSARAVGQVPGRMLSPPASLQGMRRNPFAPAVPCHRVIASTLTLGGFNGTWGAGSSEVQRKQRMLQEEGVAFAGGKVSSQAYVLDAQQLADLAAAHRQQQARGSKQ